MLQYVSAIAKQGGMAMSNGYAVTFDFLDPTGAKSYIDLTTIMGSSLGENIYELFCDEAQLPTMQAATGQLTGRYLGEGVVNYPHTRMYSDFSLGWVCDANMIPYKFLHEWWSYIFQESYDEQIVLGPAVGRSTRETALQAQPMQRNRTVRLRYPRSYQCNVRIAKIEKGSNKELERTSQVHILEEAFPYTVDAVPLSYGQSQLVKVTANFYYSKHSFVIGDARRPAPPTPPAPPAQQQSTDEFGNTNGPGSSFVPRDSATGAPI